MHSTKFMTYRLLVWTFAMVCILQCSADAQTTLFVDDDAPAGGDGLSWDSAFAYLQDALVIAGNPQNGVAEIHIGQGTYKPDRDVAHPGGTGSRNATFLLRYFCAVKGGYAGIGATNPDARDVEVFPTILSGDLSGNDDDQSIYVNDNSYHVVTGSNTDNTAQLDGVIITSGNPGPYNTGGGALYVTNGSPIITSCTLKHTVGTYYTASAVYTSNSDLQLRDSQFIDNKIGISITGSGQPAIINCALIDNPKGILINQESDASIENCSFTDNAVAIVASRATIQACSFVNNARALQIGEAAADEQTTVSNCTFSGHTDGTIELSHADIQIADCQFTGNSGDSGGAIDMYDSNLVAVRCTFDGNSSLDSYSNEGGGAVRNYYGTCCLKDCTLTNNFAIRGGAVRNEHSTFKAISCSFSDNIAEERGGAFHNETYSGTIVQLAFINCTFFRNEAGELGGAIYSKEDDLKVTNCTFVSNDAPTGGGIFSPSGSTLRVFNSVLWKNTGGNISGLAARTVRYSNIGGGQAGTGNINVNPKFIDYLNGNLHLRQSSPCIDAGRNSYLPQSIETDIDGNLRFVDRPQTPDTGVGTPPLVDMGAFEFQP